MGCVESSFKEKQLKRNTNELSVLLRLTSQQRDFYFWPRSQSCSFVEIHKPRLHKREQECK